MAVIDVAGFVADTKSQAIDHGFHVHDERHFVETYSLRQLWEVDLHPEEACHGPIDLHLSLDVDPRAVRLLAGGSEPALRPVAWSSSGHHGDVGGPLPEAGARLSVSAGDPLILFFDVTHEALEARGECVLEVEVEQGDGEPRALRLRLRPERVWHFLLLG